MLKLIVEGKLINIAKISDPKIFKESIFLKAFNDVSMEEHSNSQESYPTLFEYKSKFNFIMAIIAELFYKGILKIVIY